MADKESYDISLVLDQHVQWPGDSPYSRLWRESLATNDVSNTSDLRMSAHAGTHIEAPAHVIAGGATIDKFPIERFILPACVAEIPNMKFVQADDIQHAPVNPGEALLLKTRNSMDGLIQSGEFDGEYAFLKESAARWCVEKQLSMVGVDYLSVDSSSASSLPAHVILLGAGVLILEAIDLSLVPPGRYMLSCLPLRLCGCEASPVRAVLTPVAQLD